MKHQLATRIVMLLAFTATIIAFSAFRQPTTTNEPYSFREDNRGYQDTTTPRKRSRVSDGELDDKIEKAMQNLEIQMKQLDVQMKKLDLSKMQKEIDASLSKVDFDKIGRELDEAMKKIDWNKVERETAQSLAEVKKINMTKIKEEMEKAKLDIEKHKSTLKLQEGKIKQDVEKAMEKAKHNMQDAMNNLEKAKVDLQVMREFTDELQKDGLIDNKKGYKLEIKNGEFYINGTLQSKEVTEKYRKYFKNGDHTIINDGAGKVRI